MMPLEYLKRVVDPYLNERLKSSGAVLIEGAKWCGKTSTARNISESNLFMQDPDRRESYFGLAYTKPSTLLEGKTPRLIDEWQTAPILWDAVRFAVDERGLPGQFILTGSAVPQDDEILHTGTGRISRILMRPMSLFESQESNGAVSLAELFDGKSDVAAHSELTLDDLSFALARGGWPNSLRKEEKASLRDSYDYVESVINIDTSRVDGVKRNPKTVRDIMKSLSRNISSAANISTIRDDIAGDDDLVSEKTVASYINALRRIFVVEDVPAWSPSLRSKTTIRTSPKRHFVDPSIATAILRISPHGLLEDFNTFGLLFESLCTRDLRVYSQVLDGEVFHYRDKSSLEIDIVVCLADGRWGAVEVKLGSKEIEKGAANLIKAKEKINTDKMKEPSFLMVLTATEYAYKRDDGVLVVPIGCLRD